MSRRKQPEDKQTVKDESRKYYHMMLNMADDDLDPYQYRLLGHYLRWAGHNGDIPEGFRDTAKVTQMSINKVRAAQKELVDAGYITIKPPTIAERGAGISSVIHVVDRWAENVNRYAKAVSNLTQVDDDKGKAVSDMTQVTPQSCVKSDTEAVSNLTHSEELLEEPLREEQEREEPAPALPLAVLPEMIAVNEGLRVVTPVKEPEVTPPNTTPQTPSSAPPPIPPKDNEPSLLPRPRDLMTENMRGWQIIELFIKAWDERYQDKTVHHKSWFKKQAAALAEVQPPFTDDEITTATKNGIAAKGAKFTFDGLGQALKELRMSLVPKPDATPIVPPGFKLPKPIIPSVAPKPVLPKVSGDDNGK